MHTILIKVEGDSLLGFESGNGFQDSEKKNYKNPSKDPLKHQSQFKPKKV